MFCSKLEFGLGVCGFWNFFFWVKFGWIEVCGEFVMNLFLDFCCRVWKLVWSWVVGVGCLLVGVVEVLSFDFVFCLGWVCLSFLGGGDFFVVFVVCV